jgi:ribose transport system ATP-binding protein
MMSQSQQSLITPVTPPLKETRHAVQLQKIVKSFNGIQVLKEVDFELRQGEVHALLGGNGAGKSTLMKILEGVYVPDSGTVQVAGETVSITSTQDAKRHGIAMIFQEFSLVPTLTVAQNVFLTRESRTGLGLLDDRSSEKQTRQLFTDIGVDINPKAIVKTLSTGAWQLTEIVKALSQKARVLIMDEPTASLTASETEALFSLIRRLKGQGLSVVYISHRMEEIFQIADRVTVLRDGQRVSTEDIANVTMADLIEHIVGKKVEGVFEWHERQAKRLGTPLLEINDLHSDNGLNGVSLQLYPGEIIGLAGLMGSGRTELARALFGIDRVTKGSVKIKGKVVNIRNPRDAVKEGLSLIPEDRRAQGLVLDHAVKDNLVLPRIDSLTERGLVNDQKVNALSEELVKRLNIRTSSIHKQIRLLSGGNQQKGVVAKWLAVDPEVLIMDEPTAGIDIGAKGEIVTMIRDLANSGKGIIVISSELPELLAVSDRIVVLRDGSLEQELARRDITSEQALQHVLHKG